MSQEQQQTEIKKKEILFRNPITGDIISSVEVPKYIKLTHTEVCNLQPLKSRLKMLYVDVLCRGYHPIKGFQSTARNVFKHEKFEDTSLSLNKTVNLIAIANNQAVGTIWRCLARQIGKPIKNYNMKQVQRQLLNQMKTLKDSSSLKQIDIITKLNQKQKIQYRQYERQLQQLEQNLKEEMTKIAIKCNQEQQKSQQTKKHIIKVMGQQIMELERDIFLKSLVGIRQWQENTQLVQYVMEQSYPHIKMSKKKAIETLGEDIFNQKWDKYRFLANKYQLEGEVLTVCHHCLSPINHLSRHVGCNDQRATLNVCNSILTNPYRYCRQVINDNCWQKQSKNYIHPYLIYYVLKDNDKVPICNRYFCNKCEGLQSDLSIIGFCGFCAGNCQCTRCTGMDMLTKMMGVYLDNGGQLKQITDNFFMYFDTKLLQTKTKKNLKSVQQRQQQFRDYLSVFYDQKILMKRKDITNFQKIQYFSQRIQKQSRKKIQKYKMMKLKLAESKLDQGERQRKQYQDRLRTQKLNDILDGKKDKIGKEQSHDKNNKKQNQIEEEQPQCDIYQDSDS